MIMKSLKEVLFDAYKLEGSLPCYELGCTHKCEPGHDRNALDSESVLYLPGERVYLANTLAEVDGEGAKEYLQASSVFRSSTGYALHYIPGNKTCAFFNGERCKFYSSRPIDCRSYPLVPKAVFEKKGKAYLRFFVDEVCPASNNTEHISRWIQVWQKIAPFVSPAWWQAAEELGLILQGYKELALQVSYQLETPAKFRPEVGGLKEKARLSVKDDLKGIVVKEGMNEEMKEGDYVEVIPEDYAKPSCSQCNGKGILKINNVEQFCFCAEKAFKKKHEMNIDIIRRK